MATRTTIGDVAINTNVGREYPAVTPLHEHGRARFPANDGPVGRRFSNDARPRRSPSAFPGF